MAVQRIDGLPDDPLAAAAAFHAEWLAILNPPRQGEVAARSADGGGSPHHAASLGADGPHHHASHGPPPRSGEELVLIFPPADHTHRAWRLAAVQGLARELAPRRVNALASDSEAAIAAALAYLEGAEGLTGQYLPLDDAGAGSVIGSAA